MSPGPERNQAVARARFSPFAAAALCAGGGPCVSGTPAAVRDAHGYPRVRLRAVLPAQSACGFDHLGGPLSNKRAARDPARTRTRLPRADP